VCFFLEDFNEAGVDVVARPPVEANVDLTRVLVPSAAAAALCRITSCSPGSNDVGSADMLPG